MTGREVERGNVKNGDGRGGKERERWGRVKGRWKMGGEGERRVKERSMERRGRTERGMEQKKDGRERGEKEMRIHMMQNTHLLKNSSESFIDFLVSVLSFLLFFSFRIGDWNRKSPKPYHLQPPNFTHI